MCTKPVFIDNPLRYHEKNISLLGGVYISPSNLYSHKDKIQVPCGKCAECRNVYFQSIFQRAVIESKSSYMYFVTLTYDNKHIPILQIANHEFYYADYTHIQNMFKRLRNDDVLGRDFRYLCVNEYGDANLRPHFHILLFVSKLDIDNEITPYEIERTLFDNLAPRFAKNIGNRKFPNYEQLFTYRTNYQNGVLRSNYFVKYVDVCENDETDTTYKTINYLIGYVNKPQKVSPLLSKLLSSYTDLTFVNRVIQKLSSKVRYSKGFGFGFDNGKKQYLKPIYTSISGKRTLYTDLFNSLPETFEEFVKYYPDMYSSILEYFENVDFLRYSDFEDMYLNIDVVEFKYILIAMRYNMACVQNLRCLSSKKLTSTIRYYFDLKLPFKHSYTAVNTFTDIENKDTYVFKCIRNSIRVGLDCKLPFLPFVYGKNVQPLCNFYKRTCTYPFDIERMYDMLGVANFDEWVVLFSAYINDKKAVQQQKNVFTHQEGEENICIYQKHHIALCQQNKVNVFELLYNLI